MRRLAVVLAAALPMALAAPGAGHAATAAPAAKSVPGEVPLPGASIAAVVNGEVISNADVDNRARLFALSAGLPMSPEVLDRLKPQIARQLVDERLRLQESQRRKIAVPDAAIAAAIHDIEQRNNMAPGALSRKLAADGVSQRTLIDQIRTQLAWTQVLRETLADKLNISDAEIDEQQRLLQQQIGKQEFRVGEIFIPIDDPANADDAQRFADIVIKELRAGAPFPIIAAEFSQTQSALEGGELGWVQQNQLDPEVARLVQEMPVGAISNPVRVPGGVSIVNLQGKREFGRDVATLLRIRQVFLPFASALDPQHPTEQQQQTLLKAQRISASTHSCDQLEDIAKANNQSRPVDPGEIRLASVNPPAFRQLLATLPLGKASQPLVTTEGINVVAVCSRDQQNLSTFSREDIQRQLVGERVEQQSRQMMRTLRRDATIDIRMRQA